MSATGRTRIIAHRGASGYLPEHSLAAKALAYGQGADFLEQDLVATRDGELVVLHDLFLEDISDVAQRFPDRRAADGHYYAAELDADEIRELHLVERRRPGSAERLRPARFADELDAFRVVTLEEEIRFVAGLNATTGRSVGLYPELKSPRWHRARGLDTGRLLLAALRKHGIGATPDLPVFVQCFDFAELERLRDELGTELPLIRLIDGDEASLLQDDSAGIRRLAQYATGVGAPYTSLVSASGDDLVPSRLFEQLAAADLLIHPYTFRYDEPPAPAASFEALIDCFIRGLGVDALFCDHPDRAVAIRDRRHSA